jgi:16S rRNA processing protein RimM
VAANDFLRVGRVLGAHGVRGWVKVKAYGDSPEVFRPGGVVRMVSVDGAADVARRFTIREARPHGNVVRLHLAGVENRDASEALAGLDMWMGRSELPAPDADSYYWHDLLGLRVYDAADPAGERFLGRIESIIETGSNDVYVVRDGDRETLVPALAWVVETVDLAAGTMRVTLPEGL